MLEKIKRLRTISGRVIRGDGYGREIGFPTANLDRRQYAREHLKIKLGVYSGWADVGAASSRPKKPNTPSPLIPPPRGGREIWRAGIVIGPVDKSGLPKIEAHLVGFKGNSYGKHLQLFLGKYLRPFKKFKSERELISQIKKDIIKISTKY